MKKTAIRRLIEDLKHERGFFVKGTPDYERYDCIIRDAELYEGTELAESNDELYSCGKMTVTYLGQGQATPAQKATLENFPSITSFEDCPHCYGSGELQPDVQCKSCIGTGIKDFDSLFDKAMSARIKDTIYTYYKIRFINCDNIEYDYTIVESLDDIRDYLQAADEDLDNPELKAKVVITGVGMTVAQYERWFKKNVESQA